jgi:hypothetical protein
MTKGVNTFAGYQDDRQMARIALIEKYLRSLPKRAKFELITDLAEKVAEFVTSQESGQRPCSKVTILRNPRYRKMIDAHMGNQPGASSSGSKSEASNEDGSTALLVAQVEITNLRRENLRLKTFIETGLTAGKIDKALPATECATRNSIDAVELRLIQTFQAIMKLLEHMRSSLAISKQDRTIIDLSRIRNNVVVAPPYSEPFFEWLESTKSNLGS